MAPSEGGGLRWEGDEVFFGAVGWVVFLLEWEFGLGRERGEVGDGIRADGLGSGIVAEAIRFLRERNLIHRDIKPQV